MSGRGKLPVRDLVTLSLLGAMTVAAKELMAALPNIEPVTLLLMCATLVYGLRALYPCCIYILLEGLLYGFGLWFISYLYVWPLLVVVTHAMRRCRSRVVWTAFAALYGLAFGPLTAIPYLFIGGWSMAFSYWIAGIPFDLAHFLGNGVMAGALLRPLTELVRKLAFGGKGDKP